MRFHNCLKFYKIKLENRTGTENAKHENQNDTRSSLGLLEIEAKLP